jgi:hypothetical protein
VKRLRDAVPHGPLDGLHDQNVVESERGLYHLRNSDGCAPVVEFLAEIPKPGPGSPSGLRSSQVQELVQELGS